MNDEAKMWNDAPPAQMPVSVEQRNELLAKHYHALVSKPVFKVGQKVLANELGEVTNTMEPGQFAVITAISEKSVEIQTFNNEGRLERWNTDPRFLKKEKE